MTGGRYSFTATVWEQASTGSWHFVSLPADQADEIEETYGRGGRGFGSVRVQVTIGSSTWATSLFPDSRRRTYVLPLKKAVRTAEHLAAGDTTDVTVVIDA